MRIFFGKPFHITQITLRITPIIGESLAQVFRQMVYDFLSPPLFLLLLQDALADIPIQRQHIGVIDEGAKRNLIGKEDDGVF